VLIRFSAERPHQNEHRREPSEKPEMRPSLRFGLTRPSPIAVIDQERNKNTCNIANELADKGDEAVAIFLDETDRWTDSYFNPNSVKANRRLMFFRPPETTWFGNAGAR
jgi:hypothetical protein